MRRVLLLLVFHLPLFGQTTAAPPATAPVQTRPSVQHLLRSGPMLGYSQMTETVVWLQTKQPARVQVRFWREGEPRTARVSEVLHASAENDHIVRFTISDLEFGSKYEYEIYLEGIRYDAPHRFSFQTQPMWRYRKDPPAFRFVIGSCAYINDPPFDRPGKPYGAEMGIFNTILAQKPDFMLWIGDNVYYRDADWLSVRAMRARYAQNRQLPELQPLLASVHHYATWDDHDYGPNNSDRTYPLRTESLQIFQDYWANQTYGLDDVPGVFGRFVWNDVEFFLLDDRYHRSPNAMQPPEKREMLGGAQLEWLLESLRSSNATFKVVINGNQMLNPLAFDETLNEFPTEQKELFEFLRTGEVEGVIFVSGDKHHTELIRRTDVAPYPLYDVTVSPLTAGTFFGKEETNNPARVPGTLVVERNFATVDVTGSAKDRKFEIRTYDYSGKLLWTHVIGATELKKSK